MKSKRTKALEIPKEVKVDVYKRDRNSCILCGHHAEEEDACAHFIPKSRGGLGIVENVVTLCFDCHHIYDQGLNRKKNEVYIRNYLNKHYPEFSDADRIYRK